MSDGRAKGAPDVFRDALCRERDDLRATVARLTAEAESMRIVLSGERTTLARLTAELAAVTSDRDMWRSECESISAELDLPPGMRPMEGELRRMLEHSRALIAERDALGRSLDASASTVAMLSEQVGRVEKERDEARGLLGDAAERGLADCVNMPECDDPDEPMARAEWCQFCDVRNRIAAHLGRSE